MISIQDSSAIVFEFIGLFLFVSLSMPAIFANTVFLG